MHKEKKPLFAVVFLTTALFFAQMSVFDPHKPQITDILFGQAGFVGKNESGLKIGGLAIIYGNGLSAETEPNESFDLPVSGPFSGAVTKNGASVASQFAPPSLANRAVSEHEIVGAKTFTKK